jgi:hypothetical protein
MSRRFNRGISHEPIPSECLSVKHHKKLIATPLKLTSDFAAPGARGVELRHPAQLRDCPGECGVLISPDFT